jgi:uncharacterized RDD family membrane protein YckC
MSAHVKRCPNPKCNEILPTHKVQICPACGEPLPREVDPQPVPPPIAKVPVPPQPPPDKSRYGGFWARVVATVIDSLVVQALVLPVFIPLQIGLALVSGAVYPGRVGDIALMQYVVLLIISCAVYEVVLQSSARQATLGKRIVHLKVTNLSGQRISLPQAIGRHFAKYISCLVLLFGLLLAGLNSRKQALHDMIARTLVIPA